MDELSQEIKLSFPFTLWDRIRAGFSLMPQRVLSIVLAAVFPLIGLSFLTFVLVTDRSLNADVWLVVIVCLLFYPAMAVIGIATAYFGNKHMREPFTYGFNDSGIHVSATSYEYTHRWSTISHVKQFGGFLMFFFSPGCAHCIPIGVVQSAGALEPLVAMAKNHGANVEGT